MEINSMRDFKKLLEHYNCLGPGAEIGVAEGQSSYDFLSYGIPTLFMVDVWSTIENQKGDGGFPQEWHDKNYAGAKERVKQFGTKAIFLKGPSVQQAERVQDESLDWIYIDADHSFEGCAKDLIAWEKKVRIGGIIAGHDYLAPQYGVYQAVQDFCHMHNYSPIHTISEESIDNTSFWFIKT